MSCVAASAMCAECAVAADGGGAAAATAGVERRDSRMCTMQGCLLVHPHSPCKLEAVNGVVRSVCS